MELKLTSINFSCQVAEGSRSSWLQILGNPLIDHFPYIRYPYTHHKYHLLYNIIWIIQYYLNNTLMSLKSRGLSRRMHWVLSTNAAWLPQTSLQHLSYFARKVVNLSVLSQLFYDAAIFCWLCLAVDMQRKVEQSKYKQHQWKIPASKDSSYERH